MVDGEVVDLPDCEPVNLYGLADIFPLDDGTLARLYRALTDGDGQGSVWF